MNLDKKELRVHYLKIRSLLTGADISQKSKLILQKVESLDLISEKKRFAVYIATKNEIDTKILIDRLESLKKAVYLPRFFEKEKVYFFVKFSGWKELEEGYYGILQPNNYKKENVQNIDVIFIPGVAFDKKGVRLGWGTGTYDRLLKGSKALKVGLAYDFQVTDSLPYEEHDIKVDMLVTEKRIINIAT